MKIVTSSLILCVCMSYLIHYGNTAGFIPGPLNGGVGSYGGFGEALLLLFALPLLFGFGSSGRDETTEDRQTRLANILIKRSTLTGQDLQTYTADVRVCIKFNKDQAVCNSLNNRCFYISSVGLCLPA